MTPGPWGLRGYQIRADSGRGAHVATWQVDSEDGRLIAAAPELLEIVEEQLAAWSKDLPLDADTFARYQRVARLVAQIRGDR